VWTWIFRRPPIRFFLAIEIGINPFAQIGLSLGDSLAGMFAIQLVEAILIVTSSSNPGAVDTIAILVIVCFLIGISRAWELVGGPSFGIAHEVTALVRGHGTEPADEDAPGSASDKL
jgi:hypothetical protein